MKPRPASLLEAPPSARGAVIPSRRQAGLVERPGAASTSPEWTQAPGRRSTHHVPGKAGTVTPNQPATIVIIAYTVGPYCSTNFATEATVSPPGAFTAATTARMTANNCGPYCWPNCSPRARICAQFRPATKPGRQFTPSAALRTAIAFAAETAAV